MSRLTTVGLLAIALGSAATRELAAQRTPVRTGGTRPVRRAPSPAKESGIILGVQTIASPGITITGDIDPALRTNFGPGFGAMIGYAFSGKYSVYTSLDLAKQGSGVPEVPGTFGLAHMEVGGRATLPLGDPRYVPYVNAAIGRRSVGARSTENADDETHTITFSGTMFALGGGILHAISPKTSLDAGLELGLGKFGRIEADGDGTSVTVNGTHTVRFRFGVVWRP